MNIKLVYLYTYTMNTIENSNTTTDGLPFPRVPDPD